MEFGDFSSVEMRMLWLSIALGLVQLLLVVISSGLAGRSSWGVGARDVAGPPFGTIGARLERAFKNFVETFALFAAVVLMANALDKHTALSAGGAELYFVARVAYVPIYALGIPLVRTLVWIASFAGIAMVLLAMWPGM